MARGIILTDETNWKDGGDHPLISVDFRTVDRQLRLAALYWDKIEIVRDPLSPSIPSPAMRELMVAGVLTLVRVPFPEEPVSEASAIELTERTILKPFEQFEAHNQREPGAWSLMPLGDFFEVPAPRTIENRKVEIALHSKLPVPAPNVPIDQILRFKTKRAAELAAFRYSMDALYQNVVGSPDNAAFNSALEKVDDAVAGAFKTMSEDLLTRTLSRFRIELPIGAMLGAAIGAAVGGTLGAVLGAATGSVSITIKEGGVPKGRIPGAPFAYLADMLKELS